MSRATDTLVCQLRAIVEHVVSDANELGAAELCTIGLALHQSLEAVLARQDVLRARNLARQHARNYAVSDHYHLAAGHDASSFDDFYDGGAA